MGTIVFPFLTPAFPDIFQGAETAPSPQYILTELAASPSKPLL